VCTYLSFVDKSQLLFQATSFVPDATKKQALLYMCQELQDSSSYISYSLRAKRNLWCWGIRFLVFLLLVACLQYDLTDNDAYLYSRYVGSSCVATTSHAFLWQLY
jgi:hypothetical protein